MSRAQGLVFPAHFQRGPEHRDIPFEVKAVPIDWLLEAKMLGNLPREFIAVRDEHYQYIGGSTPDETAWISSTDENGVQCVRLKLSTRKDYEVWVRLRDPNNSEHWHTQDPIIRTDNGGER